jgi:hypothetical protein
VDLDALARLHPAWPERDSLTALIASAHESHQRPIPPFQVPPDPNLPAASPEVGSADSTERARMEQMIQARIQRDFDAVLDKLRREVERYRETEQATAEREARLDAAASEPQFQQRYQAEAARYADRIAPLRLRAIGLQPQVTDLLMMTAAQRAEQARQLAATQAEIEQILRERDGKLKELQVAHLKEGEAARARRLAEADARVVRFRAERLAELQGTRTRQQAQIQADLERSMRLRVALPEIQPPLPGPTAGEARSRAAATSASALATMDHYHEAARDVEHQLYVQRQELEQLILEDTRAAVIQLAREHRVDAHFAPDTTGPNLNTEFAPWLRERWREGGQRALGVGGWGSGNTDPIQPPTPNPQRRSAGALA